jgi:glycolate oxidase FAD binding subunit
MAVAEKLAVIPSGGCTKLGIGNPPAQYDLALDLSRMNRVLAYDPQDLTLGVEPGVRVEDLLQKLGGQKQFLPLMVPFSNRATIGGVVAANSSSPLRHAYGGVRDFCLGIEFVTGEGVISKGGGRVVKNVTGYDMHKLLIGSLGTLAIITRVNFRTFPLPQAQGTFVVSFAGAESAFAFCRAIAQSVLTPQILEVADPGATHFLFSSHAPSRTAASQWFVVVTAAGLPSVVERHARELGRLASGANAIELVPLDDAEQHTLLPRLSEFPGLILQATRSAAIFRIGVLPSVMPLLAAQFGELAQRNGLNYASLTRASGTMYAAFAPQSDEAAPLAMQQTVAQVFRICGNADANSSALLEWAPAELKRAVGDAWGPSRQDFALMKRVKNVFDAQNVLSPGRFAGRI